MAIQKRVLVKWHDEPESKAFIADVSIDQEWNSMDDYENMFFYFASNKELKQAKKSGDNGYEFRILWVEKENK